jgi:hypothetical protein
MTWFTRLFRPARPRRTSKPPARARLGVEALEAREVPTFLLAQLSSGLWRYNDNHYDGATGWKNLLGSQYAVAKSDIASNGDVAATINGYGTYLYRNSTGWQRLTSTVASTVAIGSGYSYDYVAASFPSLGTYRYDTTTGKWSQLTSAAAARLDVDMYGDLAASFAQYGTYRYSESRHSWQQLSQYAASAIAIAGPGYVAFAVPGQGTYRNDGTTRQLTNWVATSLDINSSGNVACTFQSHQGTYLWEQYSSPQWHMVSAMSPSLVSLDSGNKVGAATGAGVFFFNTSASSYTGSISLTSAQASQLKVGGG